ncbi:ATP synthase F1 subunit delta [Vibrio sp. 10N.286.49.B3]|uniref:F0F1 ATP synthase subunit delta n=1 Tax=Vibrio sp. 10N.286.49.B3 TaxID=1880855 RepID=UPI000C84A719|nr:F0F1 ATP synthase subunit delta [Vibrio sp. 10N.286.49.B3]PMH46818.1 ATP synthase F1 subunit delta [Vibrio sp. 10N.286.49.B3]
MSDLQTIAHPYAKAAFDFAHENAALTEWQSMLNTVAAVAQDPTIAMHIEDLNNSGGKVSDEFVSMFFMICDGLIDEHVHNFIRIIIENGRLSALSAIAAGFIELKNEFEKHLEATVTSSEPLTDEQIVKIKQALEIKVERSVELHSEVDPSVVGGLIIKVGGLVIDGSLKTSIRRLATSLQG